MISVEVVKTTRDCIMFTKSKYDRWAGLMVLANGSFSNKQTIKVHQKDSIANLACM